MKTSSVPYKNWSRIDEIASYWAQIKPHKIALSEQDKEYSWQAFDTAINRTVENLKQWQVRAGDRVMLIGENCLAQVILIFAIARIKAWSVNVNARLSKHEINSIRTHCRPRRCVYLVANSNDAQQHGINHQAKNQHVNDLGEISLSALNMECEPEQVANTPAQQTAVLVYTTGTTGQPKGVMLSHANLLFVASVPSQQLQHLTSNDYVYAVLPLAHVYGLVSVLLASLLAGAKVKLVSRFCPKSVLKALAEEEISVLQGVPAMYARLLDYLTTETTFSAPNLRFMYAGGSPLDMSLKQQVERTFAQPLHNGYGLTESSPTISQTRVQAPRDDNSVGQAIDDIEVRIVNARGENVTEGEIGEIWVRGANVMQGYYRQAQLSAEIIDAEGWLHTGDLAKRANDGALFIVGRSKELIIRSGFNVYPVEVEAVLNAHPEIIQSAVLGQSTHQGNETVVAFIEVKDELAFDKEKLRLYLSQHLSAYKCPQTIIIKNPLPAAATGKILKGKLKQWLKEEATENIF